jgi:preprotein translocase subunit SecF
MTIYIQAALALIFFAAGLATGIKFESGEVAKLKAQYAAAALTDEREARATESRRSTNVQEAQNAAAKSAQSARAAAAAARTESRGLRDDLAAARLAAGESPAACDQHADTVGRLFDQCSGAYQELAETAQGHANDVKMLIQAWPK